MFTECSIQKQQSTHYFQGHMEHSPEWITCRATKQDLINSRKLKSYQASSDRDATWLENYKGKTIKNTNTGRLDSMLLNRQWITEKIKYETKKHLETMKMKTVWSKTYGTQKKQSWEGNLQWYKLISVSKKNLKQPDFMCTAKKEEQKSWVG